MFLEQCLSVSFFVVVFIVFLGLISNVAGLDFNTGLSDPEVAATSLKLYQNPPITVDTNGVLYIYDLFVIRKVVDGWSEIIAGQNDVTQPYGMIPEDGPATLTALSSGNNFEIGITVDIAGTTGLFAHS